MNFKISLLFTILYVLNSTCIFAENPILQGFADPHMKVWNGRMYLSVGKDEDPSFTTFRMPYWCIYSSNDLINWTKEVQINPGDTYLGAASKACWATDINSRNGLYYFYFSHGGSTAGVLRATNPNGPYLDILNKAPLLPVNLTYNHEYDPTSFNDDDGKAYIIFGRDGQLTGSGYYHYQIARMNEDMISLAETPRDLINSSLNGFGAANVARDHQYFHKNNGIYYLSCAGAYETSTNIYGPYSNRRNTGQNQGHSSFCEYNGQWYHAWEFTCDPFNNRNYRQVMMTYLHHKNNGDMVDDLNFIKGGKYYAYGVGNYDAAWPQIEAEWYFKKSGALKKDSPEGDFEIQSIKANDYLNYPNIKNVPANATVNFRISSANTATGQIEVHKDSPDGTLLGTCEIQNTGSWTSYNTIPCQLSNLAGTANLYFVFKGVGNELFRLNWFNFKSSPSALVEYQQQENDFQLISDPTKPSIKITFPQQVHANISIFNSIGRLVYVYTASIDQLIIPKQAIGNNGIYFVQINGVTKRFILL